MRGTSQGKTYLSIAHHPLIPPVGALIDGSLLPRGFAALSNSNPGWLPDLLDLIPAFFDPWCTYQQHVTFGEVDLVLGVYRGTDVRRWLLDVRHGLGFPLRFGGCQREPTGGLAARTGTWMRRVREVPLRRRRRRRR